MALATLSIDLEARLSNLQAGMDKAARLAEKNANDIEAKYNQVGAAAAGIGAKLAAAFSVGALVQWFRATTDGLDRLNDLKDATGATVENISALEDVALRTGTSFESMATSLVKFNKVLNEATPGSQEDNIFKRLGLDAQELRRIDPAEALRQTAVALGDFKDDGDKARVIMALFGKSVQEAAPFLKDLAEAGKLNATVTTAQAQAAEDFNKQLANFAKNSTDSARAIAGPLITALNDFLVEVNKARDAYGSLLRAVFDNTGPTVSGNSTERLLDTVKQIQVINETISKADAGKSKPLFSDQRASLEAELKLLRQRETFLRSTMNAGRGSVNPDAALQAESIGSVGKDGKTKPAKAPKPSDFAGTVLDPTTLAALKRLEDSDAQKVGALRLEIAALLELDAGAGGAGVAEAIRKIGEELQKFDPEAKAAAESKRRLDELLAATPTGKLAEVLKDVELINDAFDRGLIPVEQWAEAVRASVAKLPDDTGKALDEMSEFTKQFQRNVQDALGSTVRDTLRGDFDSIGDLWQNLLIDMASQAIAADLGNRIFGDVGKGGSNSGWLGVLAGLFGFAKGGAFGAGGSVMAFADGGVLTRATPFGMAGGRMGVAGEAGPEAVLPLKRGADGKLGVASAGGGGDTIINVAAGMTRGEVLSAIQLGMQTAESNVFTRLRAQRVV